MVCIKICCAKADNHKCLDPRTPRSLFGLGVRTCTELYTNRNCEYKEALQRPSGPPPTVPNVNHSMIRRV